MDGIARSGLGTQGYGYDSSSSVNELHSMDDGAAAMPLSAGPGKRAGEQRLERARRAGVPR